jgi:2-oxoisovalerate dehydrogenase E1 component
VFRRGRRFGRGRGSEGPDSERDISQRHWFSDDEIDIARWLAEAEADAEAEAEADAQEARTAGPPTPVGDDLVLAEAALPLPGEPPRPQPTPEPIVERSVPDQPPTAEGGTETDDGAGDTDVAVVGADGDRPEADAPPTPETAVPVAGVEPPDAPSAEGDVARIGPVLDRAAPEPVDPPGTYRGFPVEELIDDFRTACISRCIDDRQIAMQKQTRVFFQISSAGHEALSLALARHLRPGYDWFFPYYRDQALVLGLGVTPTEILLQAVGSADDPASGGRQMPAHWGSVRHHIVTQSSPTGSQCIPAVGCAEAGRYLARRPQLLEQHGLTAHGDELTYVSLGEGACSQGEFWESLNTAANLHLPVLYLVPDNGFAISVPLSDQHPAPVHELVRGFRGLSVLHLDGTDYFSVRRSAKAVVEQVRAGVGPALIHADVVRPYSHSAADTQSAYRSLEELAEEARHDPLDTFERALVDGGVLTTAEAEAIRADAHRTVAQAAEEALAGARPDPATVTHHVVALPDLDPPSDDGLAGDVPAGDVPAGDDELPPEPSDEARVLLGEAITRTLHEVMAADERVRVFGEDVADARVELLDGVEGKGGVFGTTKGLQRRFGQARCYNTPLSEANIVGRAVGQAVRGLRPAPEIQFFDYIWPAMTQLRSEAATIRWRSNGTFTCPLVLRVPIGGYLTGGSIWHSQSGESIFAHVPGLLIAMPSRARDAIGLLRYAFRCEDPVLFLEHKHLLRQPYAADPVPPDDWVLPFGVGSVRRPGDDLTVITWGATVEKSLEAARQLAATEGIEAEVIDLRTISPWDQRLVAESVGRTSRALVVHEDTLTAGFGAEVAAWIGEHCFDDLDAPVRRVAALDTHVPYAPSLERAVLPQVADIARAIVELADF